MFLPMRPYRAVAASKTSQYRAVPDG